MDVRLREPGFAGKAGGGAGIGEVDAVGWPRCEPGAGTASFDQVRCL